MFQGTSKERNPKVLDYFLFHIKYPLDIIIMTYIDYRKVNRTKIAMINVIDLCLGISKMFREQRVTG